MIGGKDPWNLPKDQILKYRGATPPSPSWAIIETDNSVIQGIWIPVIKESVGIQIPTAFSWVGWFSLCCEQVIAHDIINRRRAKNVGKPIFIGGQLCNKIWALDKDVYVC